MTPPGSQTLQYDESQAFIDFCLLYDENSNYSIPIEIRSLMYAEIGCTEKYFGETSGHLKPAPKRERGMLVQIVARVRGKFRASTGPIMLYSEGPPPRH
jgi:hypothetical protein